MRTVATLALLVVLSACGTDTGTDTGAHTGTGNGPRAGSGSPTAEPDAGIPPASGQVTTRGLATVIDARRPELCLGPVAESYPPQCHGIPLRGWDWSSVHTGSHESGHVRWGSFAVTGTFDGTTLSVTGAIPEAVYDPAAPTPPEPGGPGAPGDAGSWAPGEQAEVQRRLESDPLPGTLTVFPTPAAVVVDVVHDDGSLQRAVDEAYGAGRVSVRSMLVPVDG